MSLDTQRESWSKLASLVDLGTLYNTITYESNIIWDGFTRCSHCIFIMAIEDHIFMYNKVEVVGSTDDTTCWMSCVLAVIKDR